MTKHTGARFAVDAYLFAVHFGLFAQTRESPSDHRLATSTCTSLNSVFHNLTGDIPIPLIRSHFLIHNWLFYPLFFLLHNFIQPILLWNFCRNCDAKKQMLIENCVKMRRGWKKRIISWLEEYAMKVRLKIARYYLKPFACWFHRLLDDTIKTRRTADFLARENYPIFFTTGEGASKG